MDLMFYSKLFLSLFVCLHLCQKSDACGNCTEDDASTSEVKLRRIKRSVVFSKNSKLFFRLNGKDNVIPWVQIFAHGWAIRINYDLPDTLQKRRFFFKRDLSSGLDKINNILGLQRYSCLMHYMCLYANNISNSKDCGIFCNLGKLILESSGPDADFIKSIFYHCKEYKIGCENPEDVIISNENKIFT